LRGGRIGGGVLLAGFERTGAVDDPHVILRVDGDADGLAEDPVVGEGLGPEGIDFETRREDGGGLGFAVQHDGPDAEEGEDREEGGPDVDGALHVEPLYTIRRRISRGGVYMQSPW
jgi:hypothetical protein